jgi:hypothetical protein
MIQNAATFFEILNERISSLVSKERTMFARFDPPWEGTRGGGLVFVDYFNLPEARHKQKRGGGAESHNNRMLFSIAGFGKTAEDPVAKVKIEQLVTLGHPTPKLRGKTATPEKMAIYLADYISQVALEFPPNLTHE